MFPKRSRLLVSFLILVCVLVTFRTNLASAEQQVTLKDGTLIVGNVTYADDHVEVEVEGAKLSFPLQKIAFINSSKGVAQHQAHQLLLRGLEILAAEKKPKNALGLLAEAYRQAPEDPSVAYWFAWTLNASGDGTAASEVYRMQEKAISASYPRLSGLLAELIKERMAMESLPKDLLERIDAITLNSARLAKMESQTEPYAAYFRLVDQDENPIEQSAFRMSTSGNDQKLERFDDGYFLFTFTRRRSYGENPVKLSVSQHGLAMKEFQFHATRNGITDVGVFEVKRFVKQDLRDVSFLVVNEKDEPLESAQMQLRAMASTGTSKNLDSRNTDTQGKTTYRLYPGRYSYNAKYAGYLSNNKYVTVAEDQQPLSVTLKLFPRIEAVVSFEWQGIAIAPNNLPGLGGAEVTTGKFTLSNANPETHSRESNWVYLRQKGKQVTLSLQHFRFGHPQGPQNQGPDFWIATLKKPEDNVDASAETLFKELDLKKINRMREDDELENLIADDRRRNNLEVAILGKQGTVYVGQCFSRDLRNGQPMLVRFKAWLEKIEDQ